MGKLTELLSQAGGDKDKRPSDPDTSASRARNAEQVRKIQADLKKKKKKKSADIGGDEYLP